MGIEENFLKSQTANIPKKKPVEELPVEKPQMEAEQSPAEISEPEVELVKNRLAQERRKQTIEIEFDGIKIPLETESYDFEYPEHIQKETGILGYERTKISKESLFNLYKQYYKERLGFDFDEHGITNEDEMRKFIKLLLGNVYDLCAINKNITSWKNMLDGKRALGKEIDECSLGKLHEREEKRSELITSISLICKNAALESGDLDFNIMSKIYEPRIINNNKSILLQLSGNEYPNFCYTHVIGGYASKDQVRKYKEDIAIDRFFIQKIYDFERIQKNTRNMDTKNIFNHTNGDANSGTIIFNKDTEKRIADDSIAVGELTKYEEQIKQDKIFAIAGRYGFNVTPGCFFSRGKDDFAVGFSMKLDSFSREYLLKAFEIGDTLRIDTLMSSAMDILETDEMLYNDSLFLKVSEAEKIQDQHLREEELLKIDTQFNSELLERNDHRIRYGTDVHRRPKEYSKCIDLFRPYNGGTPFIGSEKFLPILINHDEIPQLSWGHAKYAHYSNEKGFNFFKFKHAEHLPEPKRVKNGE